MKWIYGGPRPAFFVDSEGRILATIFSLGCLGPYIYKNVEYISLNHAKAVVEKEFGVTKS